MSMVQADVKDTLADIDKYIKEVEQALVRVVSNTTYDIADELVKITPIGDDELFANLYAARYKRTGWEPEAGMLMANWNIKVNDPSVEFDSSPRDKEGQRPIEESYDAAASYDLGDTLYFSNATPYNHMVDGNEDGGIPAQVERVIPNIYKIQVQRYFNG